MLQAKSLARVFSYNGVELPDPGAHMSTDQVKEVYSAAYPELTTAVVDGPEHKGDKLVFTFRRAVGTKG